MIIETTSNRIIIDGQSYPKGSIRPQYKGNIIKLIFPWWNNLPVAGKANWNTMTLNGVACTSLQDFKDFQEANFYPSTGVTPGLYELLANKATDFLILNNTKYGSTLATDNQINAKIAAAIIGIDPAKGCQVASNAPLPFSPAYTNGAAGVGATLIATLPGALIFGAYTPIVGDRVLVQFEGDATTNGIFDVVDAGSVATMYSLIRAGDYNQPSEINNTGVISVVYYEDLVEGPQNNSLWKLASQITTIGVDVFVFTQFSYGINIVALTTQGLDQFASTTSSQLGGVLSDETGNSSGAVVVFNINPTIKGFTMQNATDMAFSNVVGSKIGGASNQKFAFWGASPVIQPTAVDISAAMVAAGLVDAPLSLPATKGGTGLSTFILGDIVYASAANTLAKLAGNTTTTKMYLTQIGNGTNSAAPVWVALVAGDIPDLSGVYGALAGTNTWLKAQRGAFNQFTDAATITIDMQYQNHFGILAGNRTLGVPANLVQGQSGVINVWQDDTGSRTLAYAPCFEFPDGNIPALPPGKGTKVQLAYMINKYATLVFTTTIATPAVLTSIGHGLFSGMKVLLTTTGALPTGLSVSTPYWVHKINNDTFHLSTSFANYQAGTYIATSGTQSGVHTATCISITICQNALS